METNKSLFLFFYVTTWEADDLEGVLATSIEEAADLCLKNTNELTGDGVTYKDFFEARFLCREYCFAPNNSILTEKVWKYIHEVGWVEGT